jgi:hypothetical protein
MQVRAADAHCTDAQQYLACAGWGGFRDVVKADAAGMVQACGFHRIYS